ncbi:hypothetical protein FGO68_gene6776 [Halteria grandinella]|uniref:Uncharacterized protein n=1 Tax=Halteria grandinella TaxID=5974 RepID=A0A8J8P3B9_HALGN|nr:hypothetical protein FGO68_gene6776 [Halteria grandinella]
MLNPGYNSLLILKSIEIIIIEQQQDYQKVNHPLYVPMADLQDILKLNLTQIEQKITSNILYDYTTNKFRYENAIKHADEANKLTKKQVTIKEPLLTPKKSKIYQDSHSRSPYREKDVRKVQQAGKSGKCQSDAFPETIRSSMLLHEQNRDFQVIMKFPCIEFSIHSKNFSFLKLLTRAEIQDYLDQGFQQWDELLLKHCFQYRKFNELLKAKLSSPNGQISQSLSSKPPILKNPFKPMPQSPQSGFGYSAKDSVEQVQDVYVLQESNLNEIQFNHFKGLEEYQRHALGKSEDVKKVKTQLKGCFVVGKATSKLRGRIWIKPFMIKVKSLNSDFEFKEKIVYLDEITKIVNYMKKQESKGTENSTQLIDLIVQAYTSLKGNQTFSFSRIPFKDQQQVQQTIQSKFLNLQQKSKIIHFKNDRLLFELETPYAELELEDSIYGQFLSEQDLDYLLSTGFSDWKRFLINQQTIPYLYKMVEDLLNQSNKTSLQKQWVIQGSKYFRRMLRKRGVWNVRKSR